MPRPAWKPSAFGKPAYANEAGRRFDAGDTAADVLLLPSAPEAMQNWFVTTFSAFSVAVLKCNHLNSEGELRCRYLCPQVVA